MFFKDLCLHPFYLMSMYIHSQVLSFMRGLFLIFDNIICSTLENPAVILQEMSLFQAAPLYE